MLAVASRNACTRAAVHQASLDFMTFQFSAEEKPPSGAVFIPILDELIADGRRQAPARSDTDTHAKRRPPGKKGETQRTRLRTDRCETSTRDRRRFRCVFILYGPGGAVVRSTDSREVLASSVESARGAAGPARCFRRLLDDVMVVTATTAHRYGPLRRHEAERRTLLVHRGASPSEPGATGQA